MLYLVAILPIIVYVMIVKAMDGFSIASWSRLLEGFVWGAICCLAMFFTLRFSGLDLGRSAPVVEELLKCFPLIVAVCRKRVAFFAEALIYGTAIGAGFAFPENFIYVWANPGFTLGDAIIRGFGTALLHMGCTALYATIAITLSRLMTGLPGWLTMTACFLSGIPSILIHCVYNMFLLPEFVQMLLIVVVMFGLFVMIYNVDTILIHRWLDSCISNDVTLLASIREGNLRNTAAGEYLLEVKRRFSPEVFFDICVYLGLYLELSIAAKSRMILKEAEMDIPMDENVHRVNMDKLTELDALRRNIGVSGLMVLNPIINQKATDEWVLGELL